MGLLSDEHRYKLASAAAAALAGIAMHNAIEFVWERLASEEGTDPENPGKHDVSWQEALAFAAVTGLLVAVSRVVAKRAVAAGFRSGLDAEPDDLG